MKDKGLHWGKGIMVSLTPEYKALQEQAQDKLVNWWGTRDEEAYRNAYSNFLDNMEKLMTKEQIILGARSSSGKEETFKRQFKQSCYEGERSPTMDTIAKLEKQDFPEIREYLETTFPDGTPVKIYPANNAEDQLERYLKSDKKSYEESYNITHENQVGVVLKEKVGRFPMPDESFDVTINLAERIHGKGEA